MWLILFKIINLNLNLIIREIKVQKTLILLDIVRLRNDKCKCKKSFFFFFV